MSTALQEAPTGLLPAYPFLGEEIDVPEGFESDNGELRELNVSYLSAYVAGEISYILKIHTHPRELGWVASEGTTFRCFPARPRLVRRADVAFHLLEHLTLEQANGEGNCTIVPDLVVEVTSPNDLAYDVDSKRREWLKAGAKLVWVVNPESKFLMAYRPDAPPAEFNLGDTLTAEPVLPEFHVPLADIFKMPKSAGK